MANLNETATWEAGVYQWETTDPVTGGASGIMNTPTRQLANRTTYLKGQVDGIIAGTVGISPSSLNAPVPLSKGGTGKALTANAGSIVFSDADSLELTSTADLTWDNTSKRLGIGGSPATSVDVAGVIKGNGFITGVTGANGATGMFWYEIGSFTISARYQQGAARVTITDDGASGTTGAGLIAELYFRIKQQDAMGAAPLVDLLMPIAQGPISADDVRVMITQNDAAATVAKLYARNTQGYARLAYTVNNLYWNNRPFVPAINSSSSATLPAGTEIAPVLGLKVQTGTGKVGIGTNTIGAELELADSNAAFNMTSPGLTKYGIHFQSDTAANNQSATGITFAGNGLASGAGAQAGIYVQSSSAFGTKMFFATTNNYVNGAQTAMMIDNSLRVGLGTTSPASKLHVVGDSLFQGSGAQTIAINDGTASVVLGQSQAAIAAYSSMLMNAGYIAAPLAGNFQIISGASGAQAARVTVLPGGNVGVGTNAPARLFSVAKSGKEYQIEPHALGVDIYSSGNIGYHYQTDLRFYTGVPGSGTLRQKFNASGTIQASAPTYGSAGSVNLVPVLNASGVLDRQSVGQRAAAGTNMSNVIFGYNASYADVGTATNWPSISLATTNRIVKVTFSGDGQTDRAAENLSVRLKITDGAMAVQTGNNVNVRPTTTNVPANLHITQIFTVAASGTVTAALQALNSSGVAVHSYSGRVIIQEI